MDYRRTAVGQITQNVYDQYGRLSQVDSKFENGSVDRSFSYQYDELDRLSNIAYGPTENEKLKYDTWGKLVEKSKNGAVSKFKYDHFGRLVEKFEGGTLTKYTYDNFGKRLSRITTKGGEILDEYNTYDKFGRLVKTQSNGKIVEYIYNKKNQLAEQIIDGNKVIFEYTKLGQLSGKTLLDKDGKTLSELKYFYLKSGKLTSRLANGKLQEYKYDAKNQLLAVMDMESKSAVEEYVYDASGNILKKTVNGKATTYTYDAANQLASSVSPNGKITDYVYDAAGRLVKEGEKNYEYGWLDKVMRVAEDGKELARFEYHNNNQLAKVIRENGIETFEWDGLALIERSGTKYINEPHVGGGNPILAIGGDGQKTEAIFTDMLGTSLGKVAENGYSAIDKTSFGADTSDKSSFFTGKPYVEDLGYAFLFRNYRADMGKWLSQDLIGYPDGWNNFAYCNNAPYLLFDFCGASWGNAEMVWHYQFGGGQYVSLTTMGLKDAVYSEITSNVITKLSNKIDGEIQKSIKSTSESSGYSTIYKDISVGHNFGHIVWAMGGGTVSARTNVSYSWVEYTEGDSVYRDYAWESYGTTIIYSDSFEQPFDLDNDGYPDVETGTPYTYGATWENQSIPGKSGKIYMRKADESEYE